MIIETFFVKTEDKNIINAFKKALIQIEQRDKKGNSQKELKFLEHDGILFENTTKCYQHAFKITYYL